MSTAAMRAAKRIVQSTDFDCQMGWERGIAHIIDEEMGAEATKMRDIALVLYDAVDGLMTEWGGLKDTRLAEQAAKDALRQAEENGL